MCYFHPLWVRDRSGVSMWTCDCVQLFVLYYLLSYACTNTPLPPPPFCVVLLFLFRQDWADSLQETAASDAGTSTEVAGPTECAHLLFTWQGAMKACRNKGTLGAFLAVAYWGTHHMLPKLKKKRMLCLRCKLLLNNRYGAPKWSPL